jgi:hypothetical protein
MTALVRPAGFLPLARYAASAAVRLASAPRRAHGPGAWGAWPEPAGRALSAFGLD